MRVRLGFRGGAELLFDNARALAVDLPDGLVRRAAPLWLGRAAR